MDTQNLSTLQVFQSSSHKCKNLFLQSCPKEFIQFLCECIISLPKRNLRSMKRQHVAKFQSEVRLLSLKPTTWNQRRDILASEKGLQLIKILLLPSLTICLDIEQFMLVYNKSLKTQQGIKQDLPKYQFLRSPPIPN